MKRIPLFCFCFCISILGLAGANAAWSATPDAASPPISDAQIEADWLRQDDLRRPLTPEADAAGGCDGLRDSGNPGYYGFHTNKEKSAWWQVDLSVPTRLAKVAVYNATQEADAGRAQGFRILLSLDAIAWSEAHSHDGSPFLGPEQPAIANLDGAPARFVRIEQQGEDYMHLEEVEVYAFGADPERNLALGAPATQSSVSEWSVAEPLARPGDGLVAETVERGRALARDLAEARGDVAAQADALSEAAERYDALSPQAAVTARQEAYFAIRRAIRRLALANPALDFDDLLFVKRAPTTYPCHCDEYFGWWSRPGGRLCVLEDFKSDAPRVRSLTDDLPPGDVIRPDLSSDGKKVLFAYCRYYPDVAGIENKLDKSQLPEDSFYHLYEINIDGTGLRRLTRGKYNDFDGRYLPSGEIVFLSTRRGLFLQCGKAVAETNVREDLPDSFVRCGGGPERPVTIHTLHVMDSDGENMRTISPFENFEWTPSVASDGRILYSRWDYIDRDKMWHMGLWSTLPDGMSPRIVYGNFTKGPYSWFEPRSVPGSQKIVITATGHHSITGGSLVLVDPRGAVDGQQSLTRLTPEVPFPEIEGWGARCFYSNPYPLSEKHYLVAWSNRGIEQGRGGGPINNRGLYLFDAFGNLTLLYRDPEISSMFPIPIRSKSPAPVLASNVRWEAEEEGALLVQDLYQGDLGDFPRDSIRELRVIAIPPKTHPTMNNPQLGVTGDDLGKFILGTVPIEPDGSAYFRVPSGIGILIHALDEEGMAVQTMRSVTYVQPGQTLACVGCHEHRRAAPPNQRPLASRRAPSRIAPGPEGSWPLDFQTLVGPVLCENCVGCHSPEGKASKVDLTAERAWETLVDYGGESRSLRAHVWRRYNESRSTPGACAARSSALFEMLDKGHNKVELTADARDRLAIWMDNCALIKGSYSEAQAQEIGGLRKKLASILVEP